MQKAFWVAIWQHLAFPAVWLLNRKSLKAKLLMLNAHPSTRKMANGLYVCTYMLRPD